MVDAENGAVAPLLSSEAAERRRGEERYPVAWDAQIAIPEGAAMFRGQVANISSSGCYVQTTAWVRVPPTTVVELVVTLDGRRTSVRAEARFAQSRTGVGLRFLPLEEEIRSRLDRVIARLRTAAETAAVEAAAAKEALKKAASGVGTGDEGATEGTAD
jgi:PilZ domain